MYLSEFFSRPEDDKTEDMMTPGEDESVTKKADTRKTRLTLSHINKLRLMNDARRVEEEDKIKRIQDQYKAPAEGGGEMGF